MMKTILQIFLLLLFLQKKTEAQNLVINGDLEQCSICPERRGQLELCSNWYIPNRSTPDLFKKCNVKSFVNVPSNAVGYQEAYSGEAYAGIAVVYKKDRYYREYIEGTLSQELKGQINYLIRFYVSWADYSNYFCDRLGYLFTSNRIVSEGKESQFKRAKKKKRPIVQEANSTILPDSDGYVSLDFEKIKDRESWHKVEFIYRAKGGEKYFTLGLFKDNATEEDYQRYIGKAYGAPSSFGSISYFYIDDISVVPTDEKIDYTHEP